MINLVLFYCDRMQGFFGLGAHIQELVNFFKKQPDIHITIIFTETEKYAECTFVREDKVEMLYIPSPENRLFLSFEDSVIATTLATRILQVAYPYLENKENIICWFNSLAELNLAKQIKNFIPCRIVYVHHGWSWKDHIKVENEVFAAEWKKGNTNFCPRAFEDTAYQVQLVELSDRTITVTRQAEDFFVKALNVARHKLTTIYNGIAIPDSNTFNRATIKQELGICESETLIVFSGRVVLNKGVFFLIESFKKLLETMPNTRLVLIGTGALGDIIKAAMPVWSRVTLTNLISRDWVQKWYAIADAGVLPSLMEQCSYTAIEMRFWRVPLIVSAVDGLDEMFEDGVDCLKIPVCHDDNGERTLNPKDITKRLLHLLSDAELCRRITENGYQKAVKTFTLDRMGREYIEVLERMKEKEEK